MAFVVVGLGYIKRLTVSLQSHLQDICNAYAEVVTVKQTLHQIRSDIEMQHKKWFDDAVSLGENINASAPSIPRQCKRQTQRANTPADHLKYSIPGCVVGTSQFEILRDTDKGSKSNGNCSICHRGE